MTNVEIIIDDLSKNIEITYKLLENIEEVEYQNYRLLQNQVIIMETLIRLMRK